MHNLKPPLDLFPITIPESKLLLDFYLSTLFFFFSYIALFVCMLP